MIPPDSALVLLQQASYEPIPIGRVIDVGPDRVVLTINSDYIIVTVRGTANQAGWFSDFNIMPKTPRMHPQIGVCENGFLTGAEAIYDQIAHLLSPPTPIVVQGHSRGAAIVPILAGLMLCNGIVPVRCVCWEKPWANGFKLRDIIEKSSMDGVEYWHGNDPVPLVPSEAWLVMANFQICHFGHWTLNPFDSHGIDGVVRDCPTTVQVV